MKSAKQIREEISEMLDEAHDIIASMEREGRESFTAAENARITVIHNTVGEPARHGDAPTGMHAELAEAEARERVLDLPKPNGPTISDGLQADPNGYNPTGRSRNQAPAVAFRDSRGRDVYCLSKDQQLASIPTDQVELPNVPHALGECIRCMVTGQGSSDIRNTLSENSNSGGGFLVPNRLAHNVIDLARAASVVWRAGAQTIPMEDSDTLSLANVATDPTFELKEENAKFTGSDVTFGQVKLVAKLIGTVVTASRELAEDAANFAPLVEQILAKALAAEVDRQILIGDASAELTGLLNSTGIGTTGSVGGIAWANLQAGVVDIWGNNHQPNAYVASPTIAGDLDALTSGDGSNSAALWLGPPPNVEPLERLITSNCPDANIFMGDWTKMLIGIRTQPRIEVSTEANEAFERHQLKIKITHRLDMVLTDPTAFHALTGITT